MKHVSGIILLVTFLMSCNKREDYFHNLNLAPKVTLANGLNSISDSVKIGWLPFITTYLVEDEEKLNINSLQSKSPDKLVFEGNKISVYGLTEGINNIKIYVVDCYKVEGSAFINLTVFKNAIPQTIVSASQSIGVSKYEVDINAKNSFDTDARFGGKVVLYEYKIDNNYTVQTPLSEIRYVFNAPGVKQIAVRVQDNDGDWSNEVVKYINIQ